SELQATYRLLRGKDVEFPNDYPSGCLLGCVNLIDCLSQKQFKEEFPDISQESDSPFVFICKNPQEMVVKFPIKGNPKICSLRDERTSEFLGISWKSLFLLYLVSPISFPF
ncbi:TRIP4 isoform 4, partial [Pongo abelii]